MMDILELIYLKDNIPNEKVFRLKCCTYMKKGSLYYHKYDWHLDKPLTRAAMLKKASADNAEMVFIESVDAYKKISLHSNIREALQWICYKHFPMLYTSYPKDKEINFEFLLKKNAKTAKKNKKKYTFTPKEKMWLDALTKLLELGKSGEITFYGFKHSIVTDKEDSSYKEIDPELLTLKYIDTGKGKKSAVVVISDDTFYYSTVFVETVELFKFFSSGKLKPKKAIISPELIPRADSEYELNLFFVDEK